MTFSWSHWYPLFSCFGLLVSSALCFEARVDLLLHTFSLFARKFNWNFLTLRILTAILCKIHILPSERWRVSLRLKFLLHTFSLFALKFNVSARQVMKYFVFPSDTPEWWGYTQGKLDYDYKSRIFDILICNLNFMSLDTVGAALSV